MTTPSGLHMKIISAVFQITLTVISTLILGAINEAKNDNKNFMQEFREYQKTMEKRVLRLEFKLYGDAPDSGNRGFAKEP